MVRQGEQVKKASMAITVYGIATYNGQKVTLALYEKQVEEFELVKVDFRAKEHLQPTFLAMQPFHQIPVLKDGDFLLYESRAIVRYIAEKYEGQGTPLLGKTLKERALINQWIEVEAQQFHPSFLHFSMEYFLAYLQKRPLDEQKLAPLVEKLDKVLDVLDTQLSKHKFLAGDEYSLADLGIAPSILRIRTCRREMLSVRKNLSAWFEEMEARPAFKKMLEADSKWPIPYGPFSS